MWAGTFQEYAREERILYIVIESDIKRLNSAGETWLEYAAGELFVFVQRFLLRRTFDIFSRSPVRHPFGRFEKEKRGGIIYEHRTRFKNIFFAKHKT